MVTHYVAFGHNIEDIVADKDWANIDRVEIETFDTVEESSAFLRGLNLAEKGFERNPSTYVLLTEEEYDEWDNQ